MGSHTHMTCAIGPRIDAVSAQGRYGLAHPAFDRQPGFDGREAAIEIVTACPGRYASEGSIRSSRTQLKVFQDAGPGQRRSRA